jgi:DNA-binding MarR family transcriptional regulator
MSRLVAGLVRGGLAVAERDGSDRRVQRIHATQKGRALLEAGRLRRVRRLTRDLERLGAEEFETLASALSTIEGVARPPG